MKPFITVILSLGIALTTSNVAFGQEMPKAHKMENTSWHRVVLIDFVEGKADEAMEIINNHFVKAVKNAETPLPAIQLEMQTGEWDLMLVWNMESPAELEWEVSPENEKFIKALSEQQGSFEKAVKLLEEYHSMINESTSYIATSDNDQSN